MTIQSTQKSYVYDLKKNSTAKIKFCAIFFSDTGNKTSVEQLNDLIKLKRPTGSCGYDNYYLSACRKFLLEDHRYAALGTTLQNLASLCFLAMGEVKGPSTIP